MIKIIELEKCDACPYRKWMSLPHRDFRKGEYWGCKCMRNSEAGRVIPVKYKHFGFPTWCGLKEK